MRIAVCAVDVGSIPKKNFGWAGSFLDHGAIATRGHAIADLVAFVSTQLTHGNKVALGFECPLFVPVAENSSMLGCGRKGEGARPWSAGAGCGAMATGIVQAAWVLAAIKKQCDVQPVRPTFKPAALVGGEPNLLLWEAFISGKSKGTTHIGDAEIAVNGFKAAWATMGSTDTIAAERPLSLIGAALLWSGLTSDSGVLHDPCIVVRP